ncbi:tetratricopeptide repeat protein [Chryseobacterium sp. APV1]|uniref:Tetratricopeptide repeat protein n=1 Tax=Chryseobacterium urinae TaxID=3058400 RepID=A0ABT8U7B2_9FLAO|nr:tetratricopeptide repeat protein [Chryseobacterium sp. APV1]MDO3425965.1 tetratricopeptide repeat protein [Chryseobacterium sp. APV1]
MENTYITWESFTKGFGKEMVIAEDVYNNMVERSGLKDHCLSKFDFTFVSDKRENLIKLSNFLNEHYPYSVDEVTEYEDVWEINGKTNEIAVTKDNLTYWALDMYKRGYEFDAVLDAYGSFFDPKEQIFPELEDADYYFDLGIECYYKGDLSGAITNFSLAISINPNEPDAYYSRAIVKNELYTWKSALNDYDKALEIAPDFSSALINRGGLKDENGDYQGAIIDYQKVIQLENPEKEDLQQAYFNLGNTKLNLKDLKGACESWKKALDLGAEYAKDRINEYCQNV